MFIKNITISDYDDRVDTAKINILLINNSHNKVDLSDNDLFRGLILYSKLHN